MAGIYLHIPYCSKACHYCDFHFSTNLKSKQDMIKAMLAEISLRQDYLGEESIETIYFGGGTPSLLSQNDLAQLIISVGEYFAVVKNPEVTLEANPDDISAAYLNDLISVGINRISLGTQSFHEPHLVLLNRSHTSKQSPASLQLIKQAGFKNYTADLIYGIPSPDHNIWKNDIEQML
ncbi:MAG: radical SAM protein [Bacteroidota bacterium]